MQTAAQFSVLNSQGINILAFLNSSFFASGVINSSQQLPQGEIDAKNLRLGIAFGVVNFVFSCVAFFLVETDHFEIFGRFRGRRFLLLFSLIAGGVLLLITGLVSTISAENPHREGAIIAMILIYTAVYSPGKSRGNIASF